MKYLFNSTLKQKWLLLIVVLVTTVAAATTIFRTPPKDSDVAEALRKQKAKIELQKTVQTRDASASSATQATQGGVATQGTRATQGGYAAQGVTLRADERETTDTTLVSFNLDNLGKLTIKDSLNKTAFTSSANSDTAFYGSYRFVVRIDTNSTNGAWKSGGHFRILADTGEAGAKGDGWHTGINVWEVGTPGLSTEEDSCMYFTDTPGKKAKSNERGEEDVTPAGTDTVRLITVYNMPLGRTPRDGTIPTDSLDSVKFKVEYVNPVVVKVTGDPDDKLTFLDANTTTKKLKASETGGDTLRTDSILTFIASIDTAPSQVVSTAWNTKVEVYLPGGTWDIKVIKKENGTATQDGITINKNNIPITRDASAASASSATTATQGRAMQLIRRDGITINKENIPIARDASAASASSATTATQGRAAAQDGAAVDDTIRFVGDTVTTAGKKGVDTNSVSFPIKVKQQSGSDGQNRWVFGWL